MKQNKQQKKEKLIDVYKIWAIIRKNFIVMTRDRVRLIPLLAFPIIMITVIGFTSGNTPKHIPAAIVVYDHAELAQSLVQDISGSNFFSVRHLVSTEGEARSLLDNGKVRVIIVLPPGLDSAVGQGTQMGITVIVDESDSSIAATSKQELSNIIRQKADVLARKKLSSYQQRVARAGEHLAAYIGSIPDAYPLIAGRAAAAHVSSTVSGKLVGAEADIYLASFSSTPPEIMVKGNTVILHDNESIFIENDTLFFKEPVRYNKALAQVGMLRKAQDLSEQASADAQSAKEAATSAQDQVDRLQEEDYEEEVVRSLADIQLFYQADPLATLNPLVLTEKPAYGTGKNITDFLIPSLIALTLFQGAVMGMGRAVAGEKRDGSLTRVFLTPTSNVTIILGTIIFYVIFELVRASFLLLFSVVLFNVKVEGSFLLIGLIMMLFVSIAISIGMILSTLVKTEQQYMAMSMLVSLPTMFLAGVFFPVKAMPAFLQAIATILPITYASDALRNVMVKGLGFSAIVTPLLILILFLFVFMTGVLLFFKRDIE